ncbi:MAG: nucleotidyltransferase [Proteobacteria bacterium]|nr:nucleotidyltransferase [Pseudomonadota bacterium]
MIGAYAVAAYGFPRATKDIDILVGPSPDNASSVMKALARFGAPLDGVSAEDFSTEGIVFQIGNSPRRIDILTRISGVEFQQAYERRQVVELEGIQVPVISLEDLIANKRATGRLQDLADVERLESVRLGEPQK